MNKIFLTGVLFCLFLIQANAQVTVGVRGGVGVSALEYVAATKRYFGDVTEKSFLIVPSIHGIISFPISNSFLVRTGVGFCQQAYGYKDDELYYLFAFDVQTNSDKVTCRLTYLDLPLSISYKLPFAKRKFDLSAGVSFGLNLGGQARIDRSTNYNFAETMNGQYVIEYQYHTSVQIGDLPTQYSNKDNYDQGVYAKKYNWSVLLGLNYQLNKRILMGIEAQIGLSNILFDDYNTLTGASRRDGVVKTRSCMFAITYILGQGRK